MRVLMVTAEYAPLAKVGGLADMSAGLAHWLAARGHEVAVVLPDYGAGELPASAGASEVLEAAGGWALRASTDGPVRVWRVSCPSLFADPAVYAGDVRDAARFVRLSHAALEVIRRGLFDADVLHAHDWHAAACLVGRIDGGASMDVARLLTVHNIGYQGAFPGDVLAHTPFADWAPALAVDEQPAEADGAPGLNFLRAGITAADAITTVSPTHAREILTPEYGVGLDPLLTSRADALHGILNGADYARWSPATDALIPARYDATDLQGKRACREALCAALELDPDPELPLLCMVTRLTEHKGLDLVVHALPQLLARERFQCAILGAGEARFHAALAELAAAWPDRLRLREGHDEALAHGLIAGADALLMPSRYEPCGLTQLYAMRYGTVPVVRATGGLADSVRHFDPDSGSGTGVVFRDYDVPALVWGVGQAVAWYRDRPLWRRLQANAMAEDFSWQRQGPEYESLYRRLVDR